MDNTTKVTQYLASIGIPYRVFRHPGPIQNLEQAARERGQIPEQVVRSILFRVGQGEYVMVLIAGSSQVSWPALRAYLGLSRLTMASREEVFEATGYEPGAVSPFALPRPVRILVDGSVFAQQEVSIGSGVRGTTIILNSADLRTALGQVDVGNFSAISE